MKQPLYCSRRHFVQASGFGIGSLALACLLRNDGALAGPPVKPAVDGPIRYDLLPRKPHFEAKAKAMISIAHPDFRDELTRDARSRGLIPKSFR